VTSFTVRDVRGISGITAGHVTQLRTKLRRNWEKFQDEPIDEAGELAMAGC
jgi:hypothetical protein